MENAMQRGTPASVFHFLVDGPKGPRSGRRGSTTRNLSPSPAHVELVMMHEPLANASAHEAIGARLGDVLLDRGPVCDGDVGGHVAAPNELHRATLVEGARGWWRATVEGHRRAGGGTRRGGRKAVLPCSGRGARRSGVRCWSDHERPKSVQERPGSTGRRARLPFEEGDSARTPLLEGVGRSPTTSSSLSKGDARSITIPDSLAKGGTRSLTIPGPHARKGSWLTDDLPDLFIRGV